MKFTQYLFALSICAFLTIPLGLQAEAEHDHGHEHDHNGDHEELVYEDLLHSLEVASTQYWATVRSAAHLKAVSATRTASDIGVNIFYADATNSVFSRSCQYAEAETVCGDELPAPGDAHEAAFHDYHVLMASAGASLLRDNQDSLEQSGNPLLGMDADFSPEQITGVKVFRVGIASRRNYAARVFFQKTDGTDHWALMSCHFADHGHESGDDHKDDDHDEPEGDCHFNGVDRLHPNEPN